MKKRFQKRRNLLLLTLLFLTPIYPGFSVSKLDDSHRRSPNDISAANQFAFAHNWYRKGNQLYRWGKYIEAITAYEKAIAIDPKLDLAINKKAWAYRELDDFTESLAGFEEAIAINRHVAEHWYGKGTVLFHMGRYKKSLRAYNRALKIDPQSDISLAGKAWTLGKLEKYEEALEHFDQAIKINKSSADYWTGKGWVLYKMGHFLEARKTLNESLNLDPRNSYTSRYLKLVMSRQ